MWFAGALIGLIVGVAIGALVVSGTTTQTTTVGVETTTATGTAPAPAPTTTTATPTTTTATPTGTATTPTGTVTAPTPRPGRLPAGAKDAFIGGCLAAYNYSYCLCLINELEKTVTSEEELAALSVNDPRLREAEHVCAPKKQAG